MVRFSDGNAKIVGLSAVLAFVEKRSKRGKVYSFDLPAGYTCPGARECHSRAVPKREGWRIEDGPHCRFRCYSASQEVIFPPLRDLRWGNLNELKRARGTVVMAKIIAEAIPEDCEICRLHTSGDFWCQTYFDAWLRVVQSRPDIRFYGYTKAIRFWVKRKDRVEPLPNYRLVASLGGKYDHLIERSFPTCCVCLSEEEAADVGREVDHDDSYALGLRNIDHFAVLVHGPQPAGSEAARARVQLLKKGLTGYRRDGKGYGLK